MKFDKGRILLAFALIAFVFSLLTLLFWDFVRDTVVIPVYRLLLESGLILKSIPQGEYLALLMGISLVIGLSTLRVMTVTPNGRHIEGNTPHSDDTRYAYWKRLCANIYRSTFSKEKFTWEARKLILSILANQEGIEADEVEVRVSKGSLAVPEPIRNLIGRSTIQDAKSKFQRTSNPVIRLRRLILKADSPPDPQIDSQLAEIIRFIEQCLEINRGGDQTNASG